MNAVDLYKRLPKTNCGKCRQKACMPFALSVIKGDAELAECTLLPPEECAVIITSIKTSDWREELIQSLREKVGDIELSGIPADLGGEFRNNALYMPCLGRQFSIAPDGEVRAEGPVTPWMKILLLLYISNHGQADLSGRWVAYSELRGGMVKASSFLRECEEPLKELLDRDVPATGRVLERLGAVRTDEFPAPHAWSFFLLPKIPVAILYWPGEEEFPSKAKILFDRTADRFLDVESLMFLLEGLVKNVEVGMTPAVQA